MTDVATPIPQSELHEIYDAVKSGDRRIAMALLERTMGQEPDKLFINGHVFSTNPKESRYGTRCLGSGCEMFHPRWAKMQQHSATYEGLERGDSEWGREQMQEWEDERDWYNND